MTPDEKVEIQKAVWNSGYPSACKLVLVKISNLLRSEGYCDAGEEYLAKQCGGVTPRMLRNHIRTLEADGVLLVGEQAGSSRQNVYRIQLAELLCRKDIADIKKLRLSRKPIAKAPRALPERSKGRFGRKDITKGVGNKLPTGDGKILPETRKDVSDKVVDVDVRLEKQVEQVKPANDSMLPQAEAEPTPKAAPKAAPKAEPTPDEVRAAKIAKFKSAPHCKCENNSPFCLICWPKPSVDDEIGAIA